MGQCPCRRTKEGDEDGGSDGGGDFVSVPVAGYFDDDGWTSWGTLSFWCCYCHLFLHCHWLQSPCEFVMFFLLNLLSLVFLDLYMFFKDIFY